MRVRLILYFALIVLVSVGSVVIFARYSTAREVRAYMFRGGMVGLEELVTTLEEYYQQNHSWQGAESLLSSPGFGHGWRFGNQGNPAPGQMGMRAMMVQRLRLADAKGQVVVDTADGDPISLLTSAEIEAAIPLQAGSEIVGYLLPEGGGMFNHNDEVYLVSRLSRAALNAAIVAVFFSLLLALFFSYRLLLPVRALTRAATHLAEGDLTGRVVVHGNDELATLGKAFNHMASSLQQAEENRQSMTADIAHELRTPLAVQRAHLEALQDGVYPATPENLAPILEQNLLLTRLVEDLRTLALADGGQLHLECRSTDFPALVQRVVDRFMPQANAQGVSILFSAENHCPPISVDPDRVEQILGNLLSNGLRYAPEGGKVELKLSSSLKVVQVTVRDSGPGIPEASLPRIFERFYRADRSRSRVEGGTGLGLAIARQLAEAHGGTLVAANHPAGGAVFTLELPVNREKRIES